MSACVQADPKLELLLGHVPSLEVDVGTEEMQGRRGKPVLMLGSTADGQSAGHHGGIPNSFNLKIK